jgi:hypothetical protein
MSYLLQIHESRKISLLIQEGEEEPCVSVEVQHPSSFRLMIPEWAKVRRWFSHGECDLYWEAHVDDSYLAQWLNVARENETYVTLGHYWFMDWWDDGLRRLQASDIPFLAVERGPMATPK